MEWQWLDGRCRVDVAFTRRTHMKLIRIRFLAHNYCVVQRMWNANSRWSVVVRKFEHLIHKRLHIFFHMIFSQSSRNNFILIPFKSAAISNIHQNHLFVFFLNMISFQSFLSALNSCSHLFSFFFKSMCANQLFFIFLFLYKYSWIIKQIIIFNHKRMELLFPLYISLKVKWSKETIVFSLIERHIFRLGTL